MAAFHPSVMPHVAVPADVAEARPAKVGQLVHTPVAVAETSVELADSAQSTARTT